jgi:hypothetical protein
MTRRMDWQKTKRRSGISIKDEAERHDKDAAARWLASNTKERPASHRALKKRHNRSTDVRITSSSKPFDWPPPDGEIPF